MGWEGTNIAGFRQAAKHALGVSRIVGRSAAQPGARGSCLKCGEQIMRPQREREENSSEAIGNWVCCNSETHWWNPNQAWSQEPTLLDTVDKEAIQSSLFYYFLEGDKLLLTTYDFEKKTVICEAL